MNSSGPNIPTEQFGTEHSGTEHSGIKQSRSKSPGPNSPTPLPWSYQSLTMVVFWIVKFLN